MSAFANHFLFQFRTGIRNRSLLLVNYLFPLAFFAFMGLLMTQINPFFRELMIPGMAVFAALTATVLGLPDPLVTAREAGIFRSYKISGVPAVSILTVPALSAMVHVVVVIAIITAASAAFFQAPLPTNWWGFLLVALVTAFACAGLGLLIGVVSPTSQITVLWSQLIFMPAMILSGISGVPQDMLPASVGRVARLLPPTHAMRAMSGLAYGAVPFSDAVLSLIILAVGGILAFALALYLFNWDRRNASPRGHPLMAFLALLPYLASVFL
jgi:ABC-2 type transport system permease protein